MLEIIYKDIEEIKPYENNPRHNEAAVDQVAMSIQEFGFKNPIIIDKDNEIIAGHTRLKAAQKLGMKEVPTIKAEDLTPEQVKAFRIADNKTAEFAEWDFSILLKELEKLEAEGFDLSLTGFSQKEIDEINAREDEKTQVEEDDYIPILPDQPYSRRGDIWELGSHRLVVGDSTNKEDMDRLMAGEKADLIITDPPYNVDYEGSTGLTIQNDNMGDKQFRNFLLAAHKRMFEAAKQGTPIYVFHADSEGYNFRGAFLEAGFKFTQCLIWVKNALVMGRQDYHWRHEPILYGWKEGAAHRWHGGRNKDTVIDDLIDTSKMTKPELLKLIKQFQDDREHTTIIRADKPLANTVHPTMKPVQLLGYLMKNSSLKTEVVLDPFGGSGSTLIAAEQLERRAYLMELDEKYADVIVDRYIQFTKGCGDIYLTRSGHREIYKKD